MAFKSFVLELPSTPVLPSLLPLPKSTTTPSPRFFPGVAPVQSSRVTSPGSISYRVLPKELGLLGLRQSLKEQTQREAVRLLRQGRLQLLPGREERERRAKPALLEVLEAKWDQLPERWSLERKVLECTLHPPEQIHSLTHSVPQPLIDYLSHSPVGRKVLREALSQMSQVRLKCASNEARINDALRKRSLSSVQGSFGFPRMKKRTEGKNKQVYVLTKH